MRNLIVFAHECAPHHRPESTIGAQRPAQFAKYLSEWGWRAIVVCCDQTRRGHASPRSAAAVRHAAQAALHGAAPDRPVIIATPSLPWDGLLDRCWRGLVPAAGGGRSFGTLFRKPLTAAKFLTGDYSQAWQPCARWAAEAVAESIPIDACVGEHGPDAGIFLARWFARRFRVPWVADFRDPILQPLRPFARRLYTPIARRLLSTAAGGIEVTPHWAELARRLLGYPVWTIPNGFDPREWPPPSLARRDDRFAVVYAGSINRSQSIDAFLAGLARARESLGADLARSLVFRYRGPCSLAVSRLAAEAGVADLVDSAPGVPRPEALAMMAEADALLLLSIARPEREDIYFARGFYPGKAFEYLGAGRPILCVPGDRGLLDDLIAETRAGVVLRDPAAVAGFVVGAVREHERGRPLPFDPDSEAVARYTRRNLAARLAGVLDQVAPALAVADGARVLCPSIPSPERLEPGASPRTGDDAQPRPS